MEAEGVEPHYQLIADRIEGADSLELKVEVTEEVFSDEIKSLQNIAAKIERRLREIIGVSAKVKLVAPESLRPADGEDSKSGRPEEKMMDGTNAYPNGRQRYVYLRGERSSPLCFPCRCPRNPFTFFEPVE